MTIRSELCVSAIAGIPRLLGRWGYATGPLLRRHGFDEDLSRRPRRFVHQAQALALFEDAARLTGEARIGLEVGCELIGDVGPVGAAIRRAPDFGRVFSGAMRRLHAVRRGGVIFRLHVEDDRALLTQTFLVGEPSMTRHLTEAVFRMVVETIRLRTDPGWHPLELRMPVAGPAEAAGIERIVAAPVRPAGDAAPAIVFDRAFLARRLRPLAGGGAGDEAMTDKDDAPGFADVLRTMVSGMIDLQEVGIEAAAHSLGISSRTIQWRLARQGLAFSDLVEQARRESAHRLLLGQERSITEIGLILGYSDSANFARAFRRWFGMSPRVYRRLHATPAAPGQEA